MRKFIFISVLMLVGAGGIYLFVKATSFNPLEGKDFKKLFPDYSGTAEKICSVDFLGINFKSELYEVYLYKIDGVSIDSAYPDFNGVWEQEEFTDKTAASSWEKCPLYPSTRKLYEFAFTAENFNKRRCISSFYTELDNPENYFSFIHFNDLEEYFLLYCPNNSTLYYLRRKGF